MKGHVYRIEAGKAMIASPDFGNFFADITKVVDPDLKQALQQFKSAQDAEAALRPRLVVEFDLKAWTKMLVSVQGVHRLLAQAMNLKLAGNDESISGIDLRVPKSDARLHGRAYRIDHSHGGAVLIAGRNKNYFYCYMTDVCPREFAVQLKAMLKSQIPSRVPINVTFTLNEQARKQIVVGKNVHVAAQDLRRDRSTQGFPWSDVGVALPIEIEKKPKDGSEITREAKTTPSREAEGLPTPIPRESGGHAAESTSFPEFEANPVNEYESPQHRAEDSQALSRKIKEQLERAKFSFTQDRLKAGLDHLRLHNIPFPLANSDIDDCIQRLLKSGQALSILECQEYLGPTDQLPLGPLLKILFNQGNYREFLTRALQFEFYDEITEELHQALDALSSADGLSDYRSNLTAQQNELASLQAQVETAQQRLESLKSDTTDAVERLCAKLGPAQQSLKQAASSVRLQFQEELYLAERLNQLVSTSTATLAQSLEPTSENSWAGTSQQFAQSVLPSVGETWASGVSLATWLRLHLAMLTCRLIQIQDATWVKAYRQALGDFCLHYVLPVEPTWLAFQDPWSGGLEKIWTEAVARPDRLTLVVLQDTFVSLVPGWVRPLLNLHLGVSDHIVPGADGGWPGNLRVLWTPGPGDSFSQLGSLLEPVSARVTAIPPMPGQKTVKAGQNIHSISFAQWRSWIGPPLGADHCLVKPLSNGQGSPAFLGPQLGRLYAAALQAGLTQTEADRILLEFFSHTGGASK